MKAYFMLVVALACTTLTLGQTQSAPYDDFFDWVAKDSYANLTGWYNGTITDTSAAVSPAVHAGMLADIISYYEIDAGGASDMDQATSLEYLPGLTTKWRAGELGLVWISMWDYKSNRVIYIPNWRGPVAGEEIWGIKIGNIEYAVVLLGDKSCGNGIFVPTENVKVIPQEAPVDDSQILVVKDPQTGDVYVTVNDYNTYNTEVVEKESEYDEYEVYGGEGDIYNTQIMQQPQWYTPQSQPWIQFSGSMWFGQQQCGYYMPQQQVCSAPASGPITIINEVTNEITIEWPDKDDTDVPIVGTDVDNGPGPGTDVGGEDTGGTDVGNGPKPATRESYAVHGNENVTKTANDSKAKYAVYGGGGDNGKTKSNVRYQTTNSGEAADKGSSTVYTVGDRSPVKHQESTNTQSGVKWTVNDGSEGKGDYHTGSPDRAGNVYSENTTEKTGYNKPNYTVVKDEDRQPSGYKGYQDMTEEEYYAAYLNGQKSQKYQYAEDAVDKGSQQYSQLAAKGWEGSKYMQDRKSYNSNYKPIGNPQFGNRRSYGNQNRFKPMAGTNRGSYGSHRSFQR